MEEVFVSGIQFLILQLFNIRIYSDEMSKKQLALLTGIIPILTLISAWVSGLSSVFSGLIFTALLVGINGVIFKERSLKVLYPLLLLLCSLIVFIIVTDLLVLVVDIEKYTSIVHIGSFIVGGVISTLIQRRILQNIIDLRLLNKMNRLLLLGYMAILVVLIVTTFQVKFKNYVNNLILEILFITILLIIILVLMINFLRESQKAQFKNDQRQIRQLENYAKTLELNYQELRKIKHNYVNIITSSLLYIENQDLNGLKKYYTEALKITNESFKYNDLRINDLHNIEKTAVKGILSYKLIEAYQRGLDIHFECLESVSFGDISDIRIVEMIGILMDNAMEYVEDNGGRVDVLITSEREYASMLIRNKIAMAQQPDIEKIFNNGYSTKKKHDGIGLSTLREIIAKEDNVELLSKIEHGYMVQEIVISNHE